MKSFESIIRALLGICATIAILSVLLITFFIFKEGLPLLLDYGIFNFVFGKTWAPSNGSFGAFPMIIGSITVTVGALLIGVPIGLGCAIFISEIAPKPIVKVVKPMVELLAGIPSVVYGFFGLSIIVPLIRTHVLPIVQKFNPEIYSSGYSILGGAIILAIMILPTIVNISENSIRAVPKEYKYGSVALGATHFQTITKVIIPSAKSGIIASVVLGMGRAVGETMAVILVTGNMPKVPGSILDSVSTMTGTIAMEMGYATPTHQKALFATGIILFIFIMILNITSTAITRKLGGE